MKILWCIVLLGLLQSAHLQSIDELIDEVFNEKRDEKTSEAPPRNTDEDHTDCECVPYYQCSDNGTIITNGVGIIDIRLGPSLSHTKESSRSNFRGIRDGPCSDYLDVCCKKPLAERATPKPITRQGCGERHPEGVGFRITGDEDSEAQFGEFPWMIAVLRDEEDKKNIYQCGGALIHPEVVLTAAHCVVGKRPSQLKVRAGEWDTQTKNELLPHQDRRAKKIIAHREYNSGSLYNDVALIILETPVEIAENVDVICLPEQGIELDHTRCVASGWGKDYFGKEGSYQVIMKKVDLPIVPRNKCQESLRKTRVGQHFVLHKSFVCAGGEKGKDTCKGDGGSPLVCPFKDDPKRYQQIGIVAWGVGCGDEYPGVYVNVPLFRNWIDEQLVKNNLDISFYKY